MALLDFTPLLVCAMAYLAVLLGMAGVCGVPVRILPAAVAALFVHVLGCPPRIQMALFFAVYAVFAALYAGVRAWRRRAAK